MNRLCCRPCLKALRATTPRHHLALGDQLVTLQELLSFLEQQDHVEECKSCQLVTDTRRDLADIKLSLGN